MIPCWRPTRCSFKIAHLFVSSLRLQLICGFLCFGFFLTADVSSRLFRMSASYWMLRFMWGYFECRLLFAAEIYSRSFQVSTSYRLLRCIRGFIKGRSPNACWGLFKTIWMLTSSWLLMLSFILTPNQGNFEYWPLLNCWGFCEDIMIFGLLFAVEND